MFNGHRNADKRANSFWQFLHFFPRNSSCFYYVGRQTKSFDCLDPVLSVLKFIIDIDCLWIGNIDFPNRESSIAKWLERRPLDSGVMSSSPGLYIFFIQVFFFIILSFFFSVKHCGNLYWKYNNTGFAMEKKPSFFIFFKIANTPHKGTIRHIAWLHLSICKLSIQDTMLLSR